MLDLKRAVKIFCSTTFSSGCPRVFYFITLQTLFDKCANMYNLRQENHIKSLMLMKMVH